jgi:hypothetical protein
MVLMTMLAIGGLAAGATSAHAQCGGGGSYRGGGYGGGHTFSQGFGGVYGGCGMMMGGMQMPAMQAPAVSMPGMSMNGPAAPAAPTAPAAAATPTTAAASYHCPMHPNVVASFAAKCPYCGMALVRK